VALHQRKINPAGGPVEVELVAGFMHIFTYRTVLMKGDGTDQLEAIPPGSTVDRQPDRGVLPLTASQLPGRFFAVDGFLSPARVAGNQNWSLEIHIRQDGMTVGGGPVVVNGQLTTTIPILEHVEL
jgi:hypothetical protein